MVDFFKSAKSYLKKAYNYISGSSDTNTNDVPKQKVDKTPISVIRPNGKTVDKVGDQVEISKNSKTKENNKTQQTSNNTTASKKTSKTKSFVSKLKKSHTQEDVNKKMAGVEAKCNKLGINIKTILGGIRYSADLSIEEQYRKLTAINSALAVPAAFVKSNKNNSIDHTKVVTEVAKTYDNAMAEGGVKDIKQLEDDVNKATEKAIEESKKAGDTEEEQVESLTKFGEELNNDINKAIQEEQKNLSKAERAKLEKQNKARIKYTRRAVAYNYIAASPVEKRKLASCIADGEDLANVTKAAIDFSSEETKATVAGSQTHEFFNNVAKAKYEVGDYVPADIYGDAIEYSMQYKYAEDAIKFEQDAYEYRQKVENGEIDAPWLTKEHLTKATTAIGVGITKNRYMSSHEKAELLNTWDKHAREFSDYCDVKEAFNKAIDNETNPNNAQGAKNIKRILAEKYDNDIERMPKAWKKRQEENPGMKQKASEATLKTELKTKSVEEIQKNYSNTTSEIARIVLSNDVEYKNRIEDIIGYLKGFSGKNIGLMAIGCTTHTISRIIQAFPEKANDILDVVAPTMCYAGKKVVEHIVEEKKEYEAA